MLNVAEPVCRHLVTIVQNRPAEGQEALQRHLVVQLGARTDHDLSLRRFDIPFYRICDFLLSSKRQELTRVHAALENQIGVASMNLSRIHTCQRLEGVKNIDTCIHKVIEGRIFTAKQAKANGMIDAIGGFNDAVAAAKKAAKVDKCHYITLPRPRTLMDMLSGQTDAGAASLLGARHDALLSVVRKSPGLAYLVNLAHLFQNETTLTAMPYYVNITP